MQTQMHLSLQSIQIDTIYNLLFFVKNNRSIYGLTLNTEEAVCLIFVHLIALCIHYTYQVTNRPNSNVEGTFNVPALSSQVKPRQWGIICLLIQFVFFKLKL